MGKTGGKKKERKGGQQWIGIMIYLLIGGISGVLILQYMEPLIDKKVSIGKLLIIFALLMVLLYSKS